MERGGGWCAACLVVPAQPLSSLPPFQTQGNDALKRGLQVKKRFYVAEAVSLYDKGLAEAGIDTALRVALLANRAQAHLTLGNDRRALVDAGIRVSIDTMRADVAARCVDEGACLVNDVSGGCADPDMLGWLARIDVPYVAMHWRGPSTTMNSLAVYDDVVPDVCRELAERLLRLGEAGVDLHRVVLDPGIGFAKESEHNWDLLRDLRALRALGRPVLVGASRKRFLGDLLADDDGSPRPMEGRDPAGDAVTALAAYAGAWCVRVHEVAASRDAVRVARAWIGDV